MLGAMTHHELSVIYGQLAVYYVKHDVKIINMSTCTDGKILYYTLTIEFKVSRWKLFKIKSKDLKENYGKESKVFIP